MGSRSLAMRCLRRGSMSPSPERDFGWTRSQTTGVYSVYLLVHGFTAPLVGFIFDRIGPRWVYGAGLAVWVSWQAAVLAGILIEAGVPASWRLEFAAPLAFIAMTIPMLRDRALVVAALVAGVTVVAAHGLPLKLYIPAAAFAGIAAGLIFERKPA